MSIFSTWEAYDHLEIGLEIHYYVGDPMSKIIAEGIITKLENCDSYNKNCEPCHCQIGINHNPPDCFRYGNDTAIRYIVKSAFIKENEFKL